MTFIGIVIGFLAWFVVRYVLAGFYTVDQNERAVKTLLRPRAAHRRAHHARHPARRTCLREDERERYALPAAARHPARRPLLQVAVGEGAQGLGRHRRPLNMAFDPEDPSANRDGTVLEAVTKDQLNTGLNGQLRYRVSEQNLYAYLFGVKQPDRPRDGLLHLHPARAHRQLRGPAPPRPPAAASRRRGQRRAAASPSTTCARTCATSTSTWTSECRSSAARYGIALDASLITEIDPPARGGVGAGRHQHRAQPRLLRHQPGAGRRRPEDRPVAARGRDRDPARPGRGGAARHRWPRSSRELKASGPGCAAGLPAQPAPGALRQGRAQVVPAR